MTVKSLSASTVLASLFLVSVGAFVAPSNVHAMNCTSDGTAAGTNKFDGWTCNAAKLDQFAPGFVTSAAAKLHTVDGKYAGFGGPAGTTDVNYCKNAANADHTVRTPVIFIHGNGDNAISWDSPPSPVNVNYKPLSVYQRFKYATPAISFTPEAGYNDCELFGVTYLNKTERDNPAQNYHKPDKYKVISDFIEAVKTYTGASKVDIVAHSFGVSMALGTLQYNAENNNATKWGSIRKFVNISGGVRGLNICANIAQNPLLWTGNETCLGDYILFDSDAFGFAPSYSIANAWTGNGEARSMREMPSKSGPVAAGVAFYTITPGAHDQIGCNSYLTPFDKVGCSLYARFNDAAQVKSQLNVGAGSFPDGVDQNGNLITKGGDDPNVPGVGHFKSRNNTSQIIKKMITSNCTGLDCAKSTCFKIPLNGNPITVCSPNYFEYSEAVKAYNQEAGY